MGKFTKKMGVSGVVLGGRVSGWWGGQGGCQRRIEVFVKIQKKKKFEGVGGWGWVGGSGWGGGSGWM